MSTYLIPSNLAPSLKTSAADVLDQAKKLCNQADETRFTDLTETRGKLKSLTELCAKVDDKTREEIQSLLKKAEKKLDLAGKTIQHFLKGDETSFDPRVEKLLLITNFIGDDKSTAMQKFLRWNEKLELIAQRGNANTRTNQVFQNARALVGQLTKHPDNKKASTITIQTLIIDQPFNKAKSIVEEFTVDLLRKNTICAGDIQINWEES